MKKVLHLFDLVDEHDGACIVVDDKEYALVHPDEMNLPDYNLSIKMGKLAQRLFNEGVSPEEVEATQQHLKTMVQKVCPSLPENVLSKLSDHKKLKIIEAFWSLQEKKDPTPTDQNIGN